jgi:hypothetical protein
MPPLQKKIVMLFREIISVYDESNTKHANTLCGQNTKFYYVKAGGIYSDRWALKGSF